MIQLVRICIILQLVCFSLSAQVTALKFERVLPENGLSHGNVTCIMQDTQGFMWFGTDEGLNRFDGFTFETYVHNPFTKNSISDNAIRALFQDRSGAIWVATSNGLNKFNPQTNTFTLHKHNPEDVKSISDDDIFCVYEDKGGIIWVGTKLGLNKYDPFTNTFRLYQHHPLHIKAWENNSIHALYEDSTGNMWVGTTKGLSRFNKTSGSFTRFTSQTQIYDSLSYVTSIIEDRSGNLWVGTMGNGLSQFDKTTGNFKVYRQNPEDKHSISSNRILSLFEDSFGILWIGNQTTGLDQFDKMTGRFTHYIHDPTNKQSLSDNSIFSLYEDQSKVLWVGTYTGGVNKTDLLTKKITHHQHTPNLSHSLRHNFVFSLYRDHSGAIWVGNPMGLDKLSHTSKTAPFTHFSYEASMPENLSYNTAHSIFEDHAKNIWVGLKGDGLKKIVPQSNTVVSYRNIPGDTTSLPNNFVYVVYGDRQGNLWVGTRDGVSLFDVISQKFTTYKPSSRRFDVEQILADSLGALWLATATDGLVKFDPQHHSFTPYPINYLPENSNKAIRYLYEDRNGLLWISLSIGGLYTFDRKTLTYTRIADPVILTTLSINGILEDNKGNLWLSTKKNGIYKFNPKTKVLQTYDVHDGLQGNEFNRALCKGINGEMYFGGNNGFNVFHPDSLIDNPYAPQVAITNFKVFDKAKPFFTDTLELSYSENFFSFDFVALSFSFPDKNKYAYKLENFNQEWIQAGSRRYAAYTNLDPGEYTFKVKAANHDGVWNTQGASLKIIILPPWWKTQGAYIGYSILFVGLVYGFRSYIINREQLKNSVKLKSMEAQKLQELDQMRSTFFTNISHEFRTPLTLIVSPLEKLLAEKVEEPTKQEYYQCMRRNANRLLQLINQLLDVSKLEAGQMNPHLLPGEMVSFIKSQVFSFISLADSHQIKLNFYHTPDIIWNMFDKDYLEKILSNLLSNAFKFTLDKGEITVIVCLTPLNSASALGQWVQIQVKDNGIGIPEDKVDKIFGRFYQADNSHTRQFEGTGIGLALTKELVDLLGGKIEVSSQSGKGTCFTVELPFTAAFDEQLAQRDDSVSENKSKVNYYADISIGQNYLAPSSQTQNPIDQHAPVLLIVEDNIELRSYIRSNFSHSYHILEAGDGIEGLSKAIEFVPDLVISDRMMPLMDGMELCKRLKTDERTSHIPVILLTAKANLENKIEGLQTGADDYLIKPFHTEELITRVNNLIGQRKKLRELFGQALTSLPSSNNTVIPTPQAPTLTISKAEDRFLQKLTNCIEVHLSDSELSMEVLEKEIGMSYTQLYRKVKAVTDQTPVEFVRNYRLKKAATLLSEKQSNVSEVAYAVGFNNLSYFTKCFRQLYDVPPSEYNTQDRVEQV
ncbi:two-component regulator propeller domain-containing protein [Rhodocytophaga aerolata]|uniref:histidine kinase n=1 Tax=Rhodocytophaga aerolata TaxID=455078 RepID=A0ABT8RK01_9BACT|nr:two-component regulator propeller domain-containing protein [Rhodocytophaga aerolata]MDO1451345.1 two-component regulator propeller domain-containing protein [Rhodocytophaga aerolata]